MYFYENMSEPILNLIGQTKMLLDRSMEDKFTIIWLLKQNLILVLKTMNDSTRQIMFFMWYGLYSFHKTLVKSLSTYSI